MKRKSIFGLCLLSQICYLIILLDFWAFGVRAENSSHARLEVSINQGKSTIETVNLTLSESELSLIDHFLQRQMEAMPFRAEMHFTIQGPQLATLVENLRNKELGEEAKNQLLEEIFGSTSISISNRGSDIIFGDNFEIGAEERVGLLLVIGGSGLISGQVNRLVAIGSHVQIAKGGNVVRDLIQIGSQIEKDHSVDAREVAIVLPLDNRFYEHVRSHLKSTSLLAVRIFLFLFVFVFGLLYITIASSHHQRTINFIRKRFVGSWLLGLAAYFLFLPIILLLILSIIGIMVVPIFLLCYFILMLLGFIAGSYYLALRAPVIGNFSPFWVLGFGIIISFYLVWVPVVGIPLGIFLTTLGFGSVLRNLFVRPELYEV